MKIKIVFIFFIFFISCKKESQTTNEIFETVKNDSIKKSDERIRGKVLSDTIIMSSKHKINKMLCDLDGDELNETIEIVRSAKNDKSGLRIVFGDGKRTDYMGMGNDIVGQGFDEIDWVGIFEKAPKYEIYYNNVNEDGEIISEDKVTEEDKIKLQNDGIFMHAKESCGGGIIYMKNGKYKWIQQE